MCSKVELRRSIRASVRLEDKVSREVRSSAIPSHQASHLSTNGTEDWAFDLYEQVNLKLSMNTVIVPLALTVICAFSCTLKLFPDTWPIMLKLFTKISVNPTVP